VNGKAMRKPTFSLLVITVFGFGYCLWKITKSPTPNEALLLSLFMTVLSVLASWIISRYYAKASYEDSLKVFARKAAEKVNNLSNELDRLSGFLEKALDEDEFGSPSEELLAKSIRFEDAVHLITALRSFNDTSLSDWRSIIGDELSKQKEEEQKEQLKREDRLREIVERLDHIENESIQLYDPTEKRESERLRTEFALLHAEMRRLASQVGGVQLSRPKRAAFAASCPRCGEVVEYTHNVKKVPTKGVECSSCGARLYSQSTGENSVLKERKPIPEVIQCPNCRCESIENIDPLFGTNCEFECPTCHKNLRAVRTKKGFNVKVSGPGHPLMADSLAVSTTSGKPVDFSESLLENVRALMGPQPWPKGKSSEVRIALGVSKFSIDCAIERLISEGVFKPQYDGVLYEPIQHHSQGAIEPTERHRLDNDLNE
jgi:hypothetical protein